MRSFRQLLRAPPGDPEQPLMLGELMLQVGASSHANLLISIPAYALTCTACFGAQFSSDGHWSGYLPDAYRLIFARLQQTRVMLDCCLGWS